MLSADDDELSDDEVSPRCNLFEISLRQVGRILFNEVLYQVCRRLVVERVSEREELVSIVLFKIRDRFDLFDDIESVVDIHQ